MKSNYERNRFCFQFGLVSVILLLVGSGIGYMAGLKSSQIGVIVLFLLAAFIILFLIAYQCLNHAYNGVEDISIIMMDVVEGKGQVKQEVYMQGALGILYTNFYKMVQSLRESRSKEQKEKDFLKDVISDISHQLKTPLASLKVFVDLLIDGKITDDAKKNNILMESANQLSRMEWMVASMLKLARIEAGSIRFEKKAINVNAMICQVAESLHFLLDERKQCFYYECDKDLLIECDGDWLVEAIINLVKNASDYSEEGKNIWFEVEKNKLFTRLYIRDEGMGISQEDLPNIFKRFYRVHQQVNPNSVGIGLSLSKSIIEGMGGRITVRSQEGVGTTFMITFV